MLCLYRLQVARGITRQPSIYDWNENDRKCFMQRVCQEYSRIMQVKEMMELARHFFVRTAQSDIVRGATA